MPLSIANHQRLRLLRIAKTIEIEAETWSDGWARRVGDELRWDKEGEFAQVRHFRLCQSAEFLRELAHRPDAR